MVSMTVLAVLGIIGFLVFALGTTWWLQHRSNQEWKEIDMNAPLVQEAESRTNEALRVANSGTNKCKHCGFDNFGHVVKFCAVCASPLGDASAQKKALKARPPRDGSNKPQLALRRGEWIRKTDVEGKLFWYRSPVNGRDVPVQDAYVVQFQDEAPATWIDPTSADALLFPTGKCVLLAAAASAPVDNTMPFPQKYTKFVYNASAFAPTDKGALRLTFKDSDLQSIYDKSMAQLFVMAKNDLRSPFLVSYANGTAFAASTKTVNWHRDWYHQITEKIADPVSGLFTCVNKVDQTYYINPDSKHVLGEDHLNYFTAAGRLFGRGLLHGDLVAFHLATPLLKILLGQPLSFHDLEHFDPATYQSLKTLLTTSNVESLALDFSVQEKRGGEVVTVDLIPNGRNVVVTDANKLEYLTRKTQYVLVESVSSQLYALCKGFYDVVPQELLLPLDAEELDYVLCGSDEIDVDEWERESKYGAMLFDHPAKDYFWRFVREMPEDYKRRLLHFATGSTRVPVGGFSALKTFDGRAAPFALEPLELVDGKIMKGEPCFNRLVLPKYVEKKKMKAMVYAVLDPETYKFSVAR